MHIGEWQGIEGRRQRSRVAEVYLGLDKTAYFKVIIFAYRELSGDIRQKAEGRGKK